MVQRIKKKETEHGEHEFLDDALHEIETWGDALVHWVSHNQKIVIAVIVSILAMAAVVGTTQSVKIAKGKKAASAIGVIQGAYQRDIGANMAGTVRADVAAPQSDDKIRDTYADRFLKAADEYTGTAAAVQAKYQAGLLKEENKNEEGAVEIWEALLQQLPKHSGFRPMIELRLATAYEQLNRFEEAGDTYASVAKAPEIANSVRARADAIRCYLKAGLTEKAKAVYRELNPGDDLSKLPPYLRADLESLTPASS